MTYISHSKPLARTEQNQDVLELPMSKLSGKEKLYRSVSIAAPLAVLILMADTSVPYISYLGYVGMAIIGLAVVFHLVTKVSHTQFNFCNKTIRRYFAHNPFRKFVDFDFDSFEVALSEGVARLGTVTVKLTGRNGSIAIATFGPRDTFVTDAGVFDHPKAQELRSYLAERLNIRNLGAL